MAKNDKEVKAGEEVKDDKGAIPTGDKPEKKKVIEVDEGLLRELIQANKDSQKTIADLQSTVNLLGSNAVATNPNGIQVRKKVREFDYKLRKWDGKIVTSFENMGSDKRPLYVYDIYDQDARKMVQYVNLILDGGKEPVKVDYVTFLRDAEIVVARKLSQVEHEEVTEHGLIPKKEMAENGYGMYETMVMVPVEVTSKSYTVTLKLPEDEGGREITINDRWLNM